MVALLFSDIEGSTVRWEQHAEAMSAALRRHDEILYGSVAAHNGTVFKTLGDGFCAAFDHAQDAVAAALYAQRAISASDWSSVEGLQVRMALHVGEAERRGSDYFGPSVNRVARLLSAGHGGQILVSGALADALPHVADSVQLRPLGVFRLRGLNAPERIYQIIAPDLPSDFRALRTLEAVPNNLPIQSTPLVGRRSDIAAVSNLLRSTTLVTVAGPGGVGKTRVALQCAADAIDRMEHGVWFVDLAPLTDARLIAATILAALDSGGVDDGDDEARLVDFLRPREALLVLDNCEHVIDHAASIAARIRSTCPRVSILATSREMLHLSGEQVYRLGPLDADDAAELFFQRAKDISPAFDATRSSLVVRSICERLDGIPLAIELAAARVRALHVDEIAERLRERFDLLTNGTRIALPRQQTLRALIDWSYDLLSPQEQLLFRQLSAFSGSFSLAAVAALREEDEAGEYAALELLTSLVDKSLVITVSTRTPRYRMLESIREYAAFKTTEAGETAVTALRHSQYFAQAAAQAYREFDSTVPAYWLERLTPDLDNFRAALHDMFENHGNGTEGAQMAADCGPIFLRLQLLREGLRWCERARGIPNLPRETKARVEYVASMMHNNLEEDRLALLCAERAASLYRGSSDERGLVRALSQIAQQYARSHRYSDAEAPADEAIRRARRLGEPRVLIAVLRRCAFSLPAAEIDRARSLFQEALKTARSAAENEEACRVLEWWADREAAAGSLEAAMQLAAEGLQCADRDSRMCLESNIAGYALALGRFAEVESHAREALALAVEGQHSLACAIAVAYSAPLHAVRHAEEAAMLFGYAGARMRELEWHGETADRLALQNAKTYICSHLKNGDFEVLVEKGAAWSQDEALAVLSPMSAVC